RLPLGVSPYPKSSSQPLSAPRTSYDALPAQTGLYSHAYLRFAEAVNRLDLTQTELPGLPEHQERVPEKVTERKVEKSKERPKPAVGRGEEEAREPSGA